MSERYLYTYKLILYRKLIRENANMDEFTFYYYDFDHLGNVRQVTEADGSPKGRVVQTNNYYPFGMQFCDGTKNYLDQKHKYNGKEFDRMHGLDWYDYGARMYDASLLTWWGIDHLAEDYSDISPYTYCSNNPILHIDIDGKFPLVANVVGAVVGAATDYVYQVAANAIIKGGISTECFTDVEGKSILLSAGAGFISSGASAAGASIGKAVTVRTGSKIAGNLAKKGVEEGTKYTANVVANKGDLIKATTDYAVGKAVGAFKRKPVQPTSNKKAVKSATNKANREGKKLTAEEKKAIKVQNASNRKNAGKKNKSIERGNSIMNGIVDIMYKTFWNYKAKKDEK
jgi:RHS repeat-associated protein